MQSPFGDQTTLELPSTAQAGVQFATTLTIVNESSDLLMNLTATLKFPTGLTPLAGTLQVDGRPQARSTMVGESTVRATLAPLRPGVMTNVTVYATVDVPVDNGTDFIVSAEIAALGHGRELVKSIIAESAFAFSEERTFVEVHGEEEIGQEEEREGMVVVANDGTMTAREAVVDLGLTGFSIARSSHAVSEDGTRIAIGDVEPGNNLVVEFTLRAEGDTDPAIAPYLRVGKDVQRALGQRRFRFVNGAQFSRLTSHLIQRGDNYVVAGSTVTIDVHLTNEGARAAKRPVVRLDLPDGIRVVSGEPFVQFDTIPAGATAMRSVLIRVDADYDVTFSAKIDDRFELDPLLIKVGAMTQFVPVRVALRQPDERLVVQKPFRIVFEVLNEGNVTAEAVDLGLDLGPGLQYEAGTLHVNRLPISDESLVERGYLTFGNVQPGAVIQLEVALIATRPTLRGSTTSFTGIIRWGHDSTRLSCDPFSIDPAPIYAQSLAALPFTVFDAPMLASQPSRTALSGGHGEPAAIEHAPVEAESDTSTQGAEPIASEAAAAAAHFHQQMVEDEPPHVEPAPSPDWTPASEHDMAHGGSQDGSAPEISVIPTPMNDVDRNVIAAAIARFSDEVPPLAAHIALARTLLPRGMSVGDDVDHDYKSALNAFKAVATIAVTRMGSTSDQDFPPDELIAFHEAALVMTERLRDTLVSAFPSVNGQSSVAAGIAAMLHYAGFGLSDDSPEIPAVLDYAHALEFNLASFDHMNAFQLAAEMFNPLVPVEAGMLPLEEGDAPIQTIGLHEAVEGVRAAFAPVAV